MLEFTVIEIKPLSVYDGNVYAQRVVGKLSDGSRIPIEDPGCDVDKSKIHSKISATIKGQTVNEISSNSGQRSSFIPSDGGGVDIVGQVVAINSEETYPLAIQVNNSIVKIEAKRIDDYNVGDWITAPGVHLYLESIENH